MPRLDRDIKVAVEDWVERPFRGVTIKDENEAPTGRVLYDSKRPRGWREAVEAENVDVVGT